MTAPSLILAAGITVATADAVAGRTPVVIHRRNGREWVVCIRLEDFLKLLPAAGPADGAG